jgi:hypothetical protein
MAKAKGSAEKHKVNFGKRKMGKARKGPKKKGRKTSKYRGQGRV